MTTTVERAPEQVAGWRLQDADKVVGMPAKRPVQVAK